MRYLLSLLALVLLGGSVKACDPSQLITRVGYAHQSFVTPFGVRVYQPFVTNAQVAGFDPYGRPIFVQQSFIRVQPAIVVTGHRVILVP
jgi:hypothetical protein